MRIDGRAATPSYTHSHWQYLVRRSFFWIGKEAAPEFNRHVRCVTLGLPASRYANNVLTRDRQTDRDKERDRESTSGAAMYCRTGC